MNRQLFVNFFLFFEENAGDQAAILVKVAASTRNLFCSQSPRITNNHFLSHDPIREPMTY